MKLENQIIWDTIIGLIKELKLTVKVIKIKVHEKDKWNNAADFEANVGRCSGKTFNRKQIGQYTSFQYKMNFFNIDVETNSTYEWENDFKEDANLVKSMIIQSTKRNELIGNNYFNAVNQLVYYTDGSVKEIGTTDASSTSALFKLTKIICQ